MERLTQASTGKRVLRLAPSTIPAKREAMEKILIEGGKRLAGTIPVSGAKNAALTLIPCALLTEEPLTLRNLPRLADIDSFQHLMNLFGVTTIIQGSRPEDFGRVMSLEATRLTSTTAP